MATTLSHLIAGPLDAPQTAYVLHGILGSKSNWRTLARRFAERLDGWSFVAVDLREHGESRGFSPPHTLASVAEDLSALSASLGRPPAAVIGHSFGAKCALAWIAAGRERIDRAVILDTNPGVRENAEGSESTLEVLRALHRMGTRFAARVDFTRALTDAGVSSGIAQWLSMNLVAVDDGYALRLDLDAIDALLADYFARDLWHVIESPPADTRIEVVVGGRSTVLSPDDRARLGAIAERVPAVRVTVLPEAAHWVHVDAPEAITEVVLRALGD